MDCNNSVNVQVDGINFNAHAVASKDVAAWLSVASKQYYQNLSEEARSEKLTYIHDCCIKAIQGEAKETPNITDAPLEDTKPVETGNTRTQRRSFSKNKTDGNKKPD